MVTGFLGAFGAGALLAALTIELVAPTVMTVAHNDGVYEFVSLIIGCIFGGVVFVVCFVPHSAAVQGTVSVHRTSSFS